MNDNNIVVYDNGEIELKVSVDSETVWLNREQISNLFDRDIKTIGKHINNVFKDGELFKDSVVAKFATTAKDGKIYQIEYYNLDVIISVGYRVKSQRGVSFRQWTTKVLKQYIYNGYTINSEKITNERFISLEKEVFTLKNEMQDIKSKVKNDIYHIGVSLKDLGKKWFGFFKMDIESFQGNFFNKLKNASASFEMMGRLR